MFSAIGCGLKRFKTLFVDEEMSDDEVPTPAVKRPRHIDSQSLVPSSTAPTSTLLGGKSSNYTDHRQSTGSVAVHCHGNHPSVRAVYHPHSSLDVLYCGVCFPIALHASAAAPVNPHSASTYSSTSLVAEQQTLVPMLGAVSIPNDQTHLSLKDLLPVPHDNITYHLRNNDSITKGEMVWHCTGSRVLKDGTGTRKRFNICRGTIVCSECDRPHRPKVDSTALGLQLQNDKCNGCGARTLVQHKCSAKVTQIEDPSTPDQIRREWSGSHDHPAPPGGKMSSSKQTQFATFITENPGVSNQSFRAGANLGNDKTRRPPASEIHPPLVNSHHLAYEINKVKGSNTSGSGKHLTAEALQQVKQTCPDFIVKHITL